MIKRLIEFWSDCKPFDAVNAEILNRHWQNLPVHIKSPAQMLGRWSSGCEGTQGIFPKCNFSCSACYHPGNSNRVPINRDHTLRQLQAQMQVFQSHNTGESATSQLIGGEVSLLGPETHADAIMMMQRYGRVPMSFSHGDFDYDYLSQLIRHGGEKIRFLSFAGHFDTTMVGRRGLKRPRRESELLPYRRKFCQLFKRLKRETGVSSYLAHNMTVTDHNIKQVSETIRESLLLGFRLFSFQSIAAVGKTETSSEFTHVGADKLWSAIEQGAGCTLPYQLLQFGDVRCNRLCWCLLIGNKVVPLLIPDSAIDLRLRDTLLHLSAQGLRPLTAKSPLQILLLIFRVLLRAPATLPVFLLWLVSLMRRCGFKNLLRHRVRRITFVMHRFMAANDVKKAVALSTQSQIATDPHIRAVQERLAACSYKMAHPDSGKLVPACVQHVIYDEVTNRQSIAELVATHRNGNIIDDRADVAECGQQLPSKLEN